MPYTFNPLMIPTFLMVVINLWAGWWVSRRERSEIMRPFRALIALTTLWGLGMGLAGSSTSDAHYLFWYHIGQTGSSSFSVFWLYLALCYTRWTWIMQGWRILIFLAFPALILVLMWTNDAHHLMRISYEIIRKPSGATYILIERAPFFWVFVAYSYTLILTAFGILLYAAFKNRYRRQTLIFAVAILLPFLANVLYIFSDWEDLRAINPSLVALLLSQVMVSWGITRSSLLISSPVTRLHVLDYMREGMVVTDLNDRIVDVNRAARTLLRIGDTHLGKSVHDAVGALPGFSGWFRTRPQGSTLLRTQGNPNVSLVEISVSPILDSGEEPLGFVTMLTDVSEKMAAIGRQESLSEQLQVALDSASLGVWRYSHGEIELQFDLTSRTHFGLPTEDLEPVLWAEVERMILPEDVIRLRQAWEAHLNARSPLRSTLRVQGTEESLRYIEILGNTRYQEGVPILTTGVMRDVTEVVAHARALEEAIERSEQAAQAKSRFLANITHEIRTPLGGILGLSSLLAESGLTPAQQDLNGLLNKSGEGLLEMVNTILNFSRLEHDAQPAAEAPLSLDSLCEMALTQVMAKAVQKNCALHYTLDPALPDLILGDDTRIRQILLNLLGNAIKFTEAGYISLNVRLDPDNALHPLLLSVEDTGIGIQPDRLEAIFHPFEQADSSTSRIYGGTGLGLSIVKQSVEQLGGHIEVRSSPGKGSTFIARLPLRAAPVQPQRPTFEALSVALLGASRETRLSLLPWFETWGIQESASSPNLWVVDHSTSGTELPETPPERTLHLTRLAHWASIHPDAHTLSIPCGPTSLARALNQLATKACALALRRILVVDDHAVNQRVMGRILERMGVSVHIAASGEEALEAFGADAYDAVLLDVHMPGMDGYDTARALREIEQKSGRTPVPILACTAASEEEERDRCIAAGMTDFVTKPVNAEVLARTLKRSLGQHPA